MPDHTQSETPIVGIIGWKNSGKTTLAVALIEEFTKRGLRVASVKHAHHTFQIDDADTDSARHRRAGSKQVAIVSKSRFAIVSEYPEGDEPDFDDVIAALEPADIVIVEGYKSAAIPKIEARRRVSFTRTPLADEHPNVIAIAADHNVTQSNGRQVFDINDIQGIADYITAKLNVKPSTSPEAQSGKTGRKAGKPKLEQPS